MKTNSLKNSEKRQNSRNFQALQLRKNRKLGGNVYARLCEIGGRVFSKVETRWLATHGLDLAHLRETLTHDGIQAASIAFYSLPANRKKALARRLIQGGKSKALLKIYIPAFREVQKELRKFSHEKEEPLLAWHNDIALLDNAEKSTYDALLDLQLLREKKKEKSQMFKQLIVGLRHFHKLNDSRKAKAALRADIKRVARAATYYFRGLLHGEGFELKEILKPRSDRDGFSLDASYRRTIDRANEGLSNLQTAKAL